MMADYDKIFTSSLMSCILCFVVAFAFLSMELWIGNLIFLGLGSFNFIVMVISFFKKNQTKEKIKND